MHFIVTGGAGFIGSHLTEQLLAEGHKVTVVDNLRTGNLSNLPKHSSLKFIYKDVMDCEPDDFCEPIDGIAHLAATPSVSESWVTPLHAHHNNLSAILHVLMLCKSMQIPKLVFASSAAVYGNTTSLPITETTLTAPISPYGLQKLVSEQYATLFAKDAGIAFVGLRLFNVFGPRQLPDSPYSGVISIFSSRMQQGLPITIYGDGSQTRDFVYVKDVANAFTKALTHSMEQGSHLICNIASGHSIPLISLFEILRELIPDWNSHTHLTSPRQGDIQHSSADISRAIAHLGFMSAWSVKDGLVTLVGQFTESQSIGKTLEVKSS